MRDRTESDKLCLNLWRDEQSEQALNKLIARYDAKVYALVLYLTGCDENAAYEMTRASFLDTFTKPADEAREGLAETLFATVLAKCRSVKAVTVFDPLKIIRVTEHRLGIIRTAKTALMSLPFDQKALVLLRDQVNLSYDEMAHIFQSSAKEIKLKTW